MEVKQLLEISPENSGLVIVDMQAEGCERHGPTLEPGIKNIRALLNRFRQANGKIIHVQSVRPKDHPEFTVFGKEYSLIENTPAVEFVEELRPFPTEIVVQKFSHDCF
jgi:nicotinamidase-related amidase